MPGSRSVAPGENRCGAPLSIAASPPTANATTRPATVINLSGLQNGRVTAQYLTAPEGAYANSTLTYAGQQWQYPSGKAMQVINDTETFHVEHGKLVVSVNATSAVLLIINQ